MGANNSNITPNHTQDITPTPPETVIRREDQVASSQSQETNVIATASLLPGGTMSVIVLTLLSLFLVSLIIINWSKIFDLSDGDADNT